MPFAAAGPAGRRGILAGMDRWHFVELLYARSPHARVTLALVLANVLVFLASASSSGSLFAIDRATLLRFGGNLAPLVSDGETWRLLASTFLHGGLLHIAFNMYALYQAGQLVERLFGSFAYALIYFAAGLLASVASIWWQQQTLSVGASGAVFGVYGALLAYLALQRGSIPMAVFRDIRSSTLLFVAYALVAGFTLPGIDNAAHLGGLAAGFVAGLGLARPLAAPDPFRPDARMVAAFAVLALAGLGAYSAVPPPDAAQRRAVQLDGLIARFAREEALLVRRHGELLQSLRSGRLGARPAAQELRDELAPRWERLALQLQAFAADGTLEARRAALVRYARLRGEALLLLADALERDDPRLLAESNALQAEADRLVAGRR